MAERIAGAYGLVLLLILVTFVVMMTLPPEGWGGRTAAVAIAVTTALIAFTSSDVRPTRVRLALVVAAVAVIVAVIAKAIDSDLLLGVAFGVASILLAIAAVTILRRVIGAIRVDFRTILGAVSVFALLGLLFSFFYFAFSRFNHSDFFTGVAHPHASDFLFFSYHDPDDDRLRQPRARRDCRSVRRGPGDAARADFPRHPRRRIGQPLAPRRRQGAGRLTDI